MKKLLPLIGFLLLSLAMAAPANACEECASYFDFQSSSWCKYCQPSYCGYYQCVVKQHGFEYCDSAWDVEDSESCGAETERCLGPVSKAKCARPAEATPAFEERQLRLVRTKVLKPRAGRIAGS